MKIICVLLSMFLIFVMSGCKPDTLEIEVYTSDIKSASDGEVVEVPLKATFSIPGKDEKNELPQAKTVALKYMPRDSEIEIAKGQFGRVMTAVSSIPLGNKSALNKFLQKNPRVAMVVVENGTVLFKPTETLKKLNKELSTINMMLDIDMPASKTKFRIVGDSKGKVNVSAIAIFSEKKPYLQFSKDVKKRKSIEIEFKGGADSVYNEITPQFLVKF